MNTKNNPNNPHPIIIASAARTPIGNFGGYFKDTPATQLGTYVIEAAISRAHLKPQDIDEVLMGCVLPAGLGQAPARQAAIGAGIPTSVPCTTINKVCGSSMKATMIAHDEILAKSYKIIVAGGMENMTRAPYLLRKARFGYRLGKGEIFDHMMLDGLEDAYEEGKAMGIFGEQCVKKYSLTRQHQDDFARTSLLRAKKSDSFNEEIVPVVLKTKKGESITLSLDEGPQNLEPEKISKLRPAFVNDGTGTITAANSSSISDGAAALILMPHDEAEKRNIKPLAKIIGHFTHAQDPAWFTTAPIYAIEGLLKKIGWNIDDVDLFEINEAFAAVAIVAMQELKIPHGKLNIHGGACALGHPIGASGARIIVTLLYALKQKNLKRGVASLCIGGGEATAVAVEIFR